MAMTQEEYIAKYMNDYNANGTRKKRKPRTSYHEQFMSSQYDENALSQDYNGHVLHRVAGHVYVVKTFTGKYKIKNRKARISFRWPFQQAKLVKISENSGTITFDDGIITSDGINATQGQPLQYQYEVVDKDKYYEKLFEQTDLAQKVNERLRDIIGGVINSGTIDDVRHTFSISRYITKANKYKDNGELVLDSNGNPVQIDVERLRVPAWLAPRIDANGNVSADAYKELYRKLNEIEEDYGIKIKNILAVDFNEPKQIQEAREAAEAARHRQKEAEAINAIEAQKEALKVEATLKKVYEFAEAKNLSQSAKEQLIIRLSNPNATYTTSSTSFDMGSAATVFANSQVQNSALQQKIEQQDATIKALTDQMRSMSTLIMSMNDALKASQTVVQQPQQPAPVSPDVQQELDRQDAIIKALTAKIDAMMNAQLVASQTAVQTAEPQQTVAPAAPQQTVAPAAPQQAPATAEPQPVATTAEPQPAAATVAPQTAESTKKPLKVTITSANRAPKNAKIDKAGVGKQSVVTPQSATVRRNHSGRGSR